MGVRSENSSWCTEGISEVQRGREAVKREAVTKAKREFLIQKNHTHREIRKVLGSLGKYVHNKLAIISSDNDPQNL